MNPDVPEPLLDQFNMLYLIWIVRKAFLPQIAFSSLIFELKYQASLS